MEPEPEYEEHEQEGDLHARPWPHIIPQVATNAIFNGEENRWEITVFVDHPFGGRFSQVVIHYPLDSASGDYG